MQEAVPVGEGSMLAVLGTDIELIKKLLTAIDKNNGICEIANDNANGQIIVSGDSKSVKLFQKKLKDENIKSIPLKVSAPFHCSLMKPAANKMREKINSTKFEDAYFDIICNVTAKPEKDNKIIKQLLIDQISSTVKWRESLIYMSNSGVQNFIEIGPGKILSGMLKRTISNVNCFSINSIADIKNLNDKFKR